MNVKNIKKNKKLKNVLMLTSGNRRTIFRITNNTWA